MITGPEQDAGTIESANRLQREQGASLIGLAALVLRHAKLVVIIAVSSAVVSAAFALLREPSYVAESKFITADQEAASPLAGLAAQVGVQIDGNRGANSPQFFAQLAHSRDLLRRAAARTYSIPRSEGSPDSIRAKLAQLYEIEAESTAAQQRAVLSRLSESMATRADAETGVVTLQTSARWPALAVQLNATMLELINEFQLEARRARASAERAFIEQRLREAERELDRAESSLQEFMEEPRRYDDAPELRFTAARLERQVAFRQQLFTTLRQSYEQIRIDEVRNTPAMTVLESPQGSDRAVPRRLAVRTVLGLLFGGLVGIGFAFLLEHLRREAATHREDMQELRRLSRGSSSGARAIGGR